MNNTAKNLLLTPFNILYKINPELDLKVLFRLKLGYKLNLKNPTTYNEKLQWIKLNDKNPLMPKCCDKYAVREYVESKGCKKLLNELLWEGFNPDEIPYESLPNKFVIKVTHGSTFNIICSEKSKLNVEQVNKRLKKWLKVKFLPCYGEWFYGVERPRIIIEKFIESDDDLKDYKVFCFNGEPKYIAVYSDRYLNNGKPCQEIYDLDWNITHNHTNDYKLPCKLTKKPCNLNEIIKYSKILSKDFRHARVDFFNPNNNLIFGEITFTSSAGFGKFSSKQFEEEMGNYLNLPVDEK